MNSVIGCNDVFIFVALGYSIVELSIKWEKYSSCDYPLQLFLIVAYGSILLFRALGLLTYVFRDRPLVVKIIGLFKTFGVFGFFSIWTMLGTYWFASSYSCLPDRRHQFTTFILWFVLCYVWIIGYSLFIASSIALGVFSSIFLYPEGVEDDLDIYAYEPIASGLPQELIDSLPVRIMSEEDALMLNQCAICLEIFEVGDGVKQLTPCGHRFHEAHINEWLSRKSTCPLCRCDVVAARPDMSII